jgi:outer membrane protein
MKKVILSIALAVTFALATNTANAQKFGYINSQEAMSQMPEYATAAKELETFVKEFEVTLEKMKKDAESKYKDFLKDEKTMTENMKEIKGNEIQAMQEKMQSFQQSAQEKVQAKQESLLKPISKKLEEAIKSVAAANNIAYVFDMVSTGIIVAPPGDDILPLLKTKLGLKIPTASAPPVKTAPKR